VLQILPQISFWILCVPSIRSTPHRPSTFPTADDAVAANLTVAHCGPCGFCSNMADIETYIETRKTVAASAKLCGPVTVLGTYDDLVDCLVEKVNFSRPCTKCWAEQYEIDRITLFVYVHENVVYWFYELEQCS
jgi:hypothetical protein